MFDLENQCQLPVQEVLIIFLSDLQENAQNSLFPQPSHLGHVLVPRLRFVSTGLPGPCHYDLGVCFKSSLLLLFCLVNFHNFFSIHVFEVKDSIVDIPTEQQCSGDFKYPGQLPVQEVLKGTADFVL